MVFGLRKILPEYVELKFIHCFKVTEKCHYDPEGLGFMRVNWHVDRSSFNALNFSLRVPDRIAKVKSHPHVNLMTYTWVLLVRILARYIHINVFGLRSVLKSVKEPRGNFPTKKIVHFNDINFSFPLNFVPCKLSYRAIIFCFRYFIKIL